MHPSFGTVQWSKGVRSRNYFELQITPTEKCRFSPTGRNSLELQILPNEIISNFSEKHGEGGRAKERERERESKRDIERARGSEREGGGGRLEGELPRPSCHTRV